MNGKVFVRTRLLWVAWYPLRRLRCTFRFDRRTTALVPCRNAPDSWHREQRGWHLTLAVGPAYVGIGPGTPAC